MRTRLCSQNLILFCFFTLFLVPTATANGATAVGGGGIFGDMAARKPSGSFSCSEGKSSSSFVCPGTNEKICVSESAMCDGHSDCPKGEDEDDCSDCSGSTLFECRQTKKCISAIFVCDGDSDCEDGSDETDCEEEDIPPCPKGHFQCTKSGICVDPIWMCDGMPDCLFSQNDKEEDEDPHNCEQFLNQTSSVPAVLNYQASSEESKKCESKANCDDGPKVDSAPCKLGHRLSTSNTDGCVDIDECTEDFSVCSQECVNTEGSFVCSCQEGYDMDDKGTCKVDHQKTPPMLLFSTKTQIRSLQHIGNYDFETVVASHRELPLDQLRHAIGVGFDVENHRIYWSAIEENHGGIMYAPLDGEGSQNNTYLIQDPTFKSIEGLAIDYHGRNVYFTHMGPVKSNESFVGVASMNAKGAWKRLIVKGVEKPRGIAVFPPEALLFYAEWGSQPALMVADMDGTSVKALVSQDMLWVNGVTVDVAKRRVYWTDARRNVIESVRFDGSDRRVNVRVEQDRQHVFYLAIFEDWLFFTDWKAKSLWRCNKFNGTEMTTVFRSREESPMGVTIYHPLLEPMDMNPCLSARCSQICLLSRKARLGYVCDCSNDFQLSSNGWKCEKKVEFIPNADNLTPSSKNTTGVRQSHVPTSGKLSPPTGTENRNLSLIPATEHHCPEGNGCSYECRMSDTHPQGYLCACPEGQQLDPDGHTCVTPVQSPTSASDGTGEATTSAKVTGPCSSLQCSHDCQDGLCTCPEGLVLDSSGLNCTNAHHYDSNRESLCEPLHCTHACRHQPADGKAYCDCPSGLALAEDARTCVDITGSASAVASSPSTSSSQIGVIVGVVVILVVLLAACVLAAYCRRRRSGPTPQRIVNPFSGGRNSSLFQVRFSSAGNKRNAGSFDDDLCSSSPPSEHPMSATLGDDLMNEDVEIDTCQEQLLVL